MTTESTIEKSPYDGYKMALEFCFTKDSMFMPEPEAKTVAWCDFELIANGSYSQEQMLTKAVIGYGKPKCYRFILYEGFQKP